MHLCSYCNYESQCKYSLNEHINGKHGILQYECSFCEFKTIWRGSFNRHMKKHENETVEKVFPSQQRQEADQINDNTEICDENYELGYGITIIQGLKDLTQM